MRKRAAIAGCCQCRCWNRSEIMFRKNKMLESLYYIFPEHLLRKFLE